MARRQIGEGHIQEARPLMLLVQGGCVVNDDALLRQFLLVECDACLIQGNHDIDLSREAMTGASEKRI